MRVSKPLEEIPTMELPSNFRPSNSSASRLAKLCSSSLLRRVTTQSLVGALLLGAATTSSEAAGPRAEARRQARLANQQAWNTPAPRGTPVPQYIDPYTGLPIPYITQPLPYPASGTPVFSPGTSNAGGYPGTPSIGSQPAGSGPSPGISSYQPQPANQSLPANQPLAVPGYPFPPQYGIPSYQAPVVIDPYTGLPISNQVIPVQNQVPAPRTPATTGSNNTPATNKPSGLGGTIPAIPPGSGSPVTVYSGPVSTPSANPSSGNTPNTGAANTPNNRPLTPAQRRRLERSGNGSTADIASRSRSDQPPSLGNDPGLTPNLSGGNSEFDGPELPGMKADFAPSSTGDALPPLTPIPATGSIPSPGSNQGQGAMFAPLPDGVQDVNVPLGPSVAAPFQIYVTSQEKFINRFVATTRREPGEVRDFVLGANVVGERDTTSHAWLNLLPSTDTARGQFVLEGRGQTRTTGYTSQAAINTQGIQEFRGTKDVLFDGFKLATRAAVIQARAQNTPVSAQTVYSGRPFIGPIAERIAMSVAQRQQPQAEIIARDRVAETVFASFNREVDRELGNANVDLKRLQEQLEDLTLMPSVQRWSSTHAHLQFAGQFGADAPILQPMPAEARQDHAVTLFLHETVLNRAADRANLRGKVTSDRELKELSNWLKGLVPGAGEVPAPAGAAFKVPNIETKIVFDDVEPLRFRIDGDELLIILKAQFQPGGQAVLPQMEVTIPAKLVIDQQTVHLTFDNIRVKSLTDDRTATLGMAEGIVRQSIQANFPRLSLPRQLPQELWNREGQPPVFNYARASDGWLGVGID